MKVLNGKNDINEAIEYIKNGKLVIFPTETVYGIGANVFDEEAVSSIFKMKGRKQDNPLIVHISDLNMLNDLVEEVGEIEQNLINEFWPGPLTIIFPKTNLIPDIVTCGLDTVGIRMPSNEIANKLIKQSELPIAAPSANISGKPSGTCIEDIKNEFINEDIIMIDGGDSKIGLESTVIKVENNQIIILRPGYITERDLSNYGKVKISPNILKEKFEEIQKVESPGMKYKHYAPNCRCELVLGENDNEIRKKILDEIGHGVEENNEAKIVVLYKYNEPDIKINDVRYICMGKDDEEISKNIYHLLRNLDKINPDIVYIESVEKTGLGIAIFNRLIRACEYNII